MEREDFGLYSLSSSLLRTTSRSVLEDQMIQNKVVEWCHHDDRDEFGKPWIETGDNKDLE